MDNSVSGIAGYVTVREAARLLRISPAAVRQRILRHRVHTLKLGKTILVRLSELSLYD